MMQSSNIAILVGSALVAYTAPALAQTRGAAEVQTSDRLEVGEIIVTAQKRSENLQDVPVAVTAVDSRQLATANIESVVDLSLAAPSLQSTASNGIYLANSVRGVGSFGYGGGIESPIGLYVDGVYQASPFLFSVQLNNVEAVEVLKGPQGTLFGRNATGGLINIRTRDPSSVATGDFSIGYGNYDSWSAKGYLSGGLTENLAADIAFTGDRQGDGFGKNVTTGRDWNRLNHNFALRSKWLWTLGPDTKITLTGDYFEGKGTAGSATLLAGTRSGYIPGYIAPDLGYGTAQDLDLKREISGGGGALTVDHALGGVSLKSITAYRESKYPLLQDIDFTPTPFAFIDYTQKDRQISQEFQLSSTNSGPFRWTAGLFYFDAKADVDFTVDLANLAGIRLHFLDTVTTKSGAAYGQGTYELGSSTNVTLGARYTVEKRAEKNIYSDVEIVAFNLVLPTPIANRSFTKKRLTWRASVDHRFSSAVLGYVSFNTGFKSGGFNSTLPGAAPYLPEKLTAYEAGLKTDLLDRRLRLNVSAFYYDYQNIQVQTLQGESLFIINGPSAKIYGLDADFTAVLAEGLNFTGGLAWLSPKFDDFQGCPNTVPGGGVPLVTVGTQCEGNQLPLASKLTFSAALNYSRDVGSGKVDAGINAYYNSGVFFESDNVLRQKRYALIGASAKYTLENGFSVGLWGKNLTDRRIIGFATSQTNGNAVVTYQDPRTYGVTVGFKF